VPTDPAPLRDALVRTAETHGPGLVGLVTEHGEPLFEGAVGVADLADGRPPTADDWFRIGSVTKTYVSAVLVQLLREGAFARSDTVEQWLPGLVPGGEQLPVELLLRMRSGLPDYAWAMLGTPPDMSRVTGYQRPEQLVAVAMAQPDRNQPGESFRYCNTDYVLLGLIAEKATGTRVDALVWQRILDPLGLRETTFPVADGWLRGPHATGYVRMAADQPYQEVPVLSPSFAWTSGAMTATPRDLARFFDALLDGRVVDPADLATMTARSEPLDEGRWRGLGLVRYERPDGTVAFGHHGGVPGYTTVVLRTAGGRTIVLCQNGIDLHDVLTSDTPFVAAALAGG
jgi:D-alanyl-D-alanine carboxypeptidase